MTDASDDSLDTVTSLPPTERAEDLAAADPPQPEGGEILAARYLLRRVLGSGGMGRVYEADDLELGEQVALKLLDPALAMDTAALERFRQEVRLARKVTHPNVARVYDIGEDHGRRFLTMERIDGESLGCLLRRVGPLAPSYVARLAADVCDGLAASHAAGVLHGDLKPQNVMRARDERIVIMDFGVARALSASREGAGALGGTVAYMAPEQVRGAAVDERADLYALGVMMYRLLTGALPFSGPTLLATATARLFHDPPDVRHLRADVPAALAELVQHLLARDPSARPAAAREAGEALRVFDVDATGERPAVAAGGAAPRTRVAVIVHASGEERAYLDRALADGLRAALSRAPGIEVAPAGLSRDVLGGAAGTAQLAQRLAATAALEVLVSHAGGRVHASARLVTVGDGVTLWSRGVEGAGADVPALAVTLARHTALALGSELSTGTRLSAADPHTVELYLRGCHAYGAAYFADEGLSLLSQAHRRAPHIDEIAARYALALLRAGVRDLRVDCIREARTLAEAVSQRDPTLADAHLVLALAHFADGETKSAGLSLRRARDAAPEDPHVLDWYGRLLIELGRIREGIAILRRVLDAEPSLALVEGSLARAYALVGDFSAAFSVLEAPPRAPREESLHLAMQGRIACWAGDRARVARRLADARDTGELSRRLSFMLRAFDSGRVDDAELRELTDSAREEGSQRRTTFLAQIAIEILCYASRAEECVPLLDQLDEQAFLDLSWLELCPVLAPLRGAPAFERLHARTGKRAARLLDALCGTG